MAKKEKEKLIQLFDKEYKESELSDNQKVMINHIADLERKINAGEFNLVQIRFGLQAFVDALKKDLEEPKVEESKIDS
tara:strand:- start:8029 stop:8262 length:234 start_codon:yes stop_codon:yes gene_type:complete